MKTDRGTTIVALLVGAALCVPAMAKAAQDADVGVQTGTAPFAAQAVSETQLRGIAGREDTTQVSKADQTAAVANNSVGDNATTGAAQIDGNAFQNMSGLSILNVNTGNNVAINAAMNVNISISPSP